MKHRHGQKKLNRTTAHRKAMLRNMVTSLFRHERIVTTLPKAKALRPVAEKLITTAKRGSLHAKRKVLSFVRDRKVVAKLFGDIAERFADRGGGYLRIHRLARNRAGDNAPMAVVSFVEMIRTSSEASGGVAEKSDAEDIEATERPRRRRRRRKEDESNGEKNAVAESDSETVGSDENETNASKQIDENAQNENAQNDEDIDEDSKTNEVQQDQEVEQEEDKKG